MDFVARGSELSLSGIHLKMPDVEFLDVGSKDSLVLMKLLTDTGKTIYQIYFNNDCNYDETALKVDDVITIKYKEEKTTINKADIYYLGMEKDTRANRYCISLTLK